MEHEGQEKGSKKHKYYSVEFKRGAAELVCREGRRQCDVARSLGVPANLISRWVAEYSEKGGEAYPGKGKLGISDEKVRVLEQKLRRVTMERDVLKKAIAYFTEVPK